MTEHAHATREVSATRRARVKVDGLYELQADAIKALAHPKRLMIVDLLSDGSERTVTELQADTSMSQSNLSQNLAILRTSGILNSRREGNNIFYSVSDPRVLKAVTLLRGVMETQFQDKRFLAERATFKAKEAAKRTSILGAIVGLGLFAAATLGAISHPLWIGGDIVDVGQHADLMFTGGVDAMARACVEVLTEPAVTARPSTSVPA